MAHCPQCHEALPKLNVEAIDGIYEIHSLTCRSCGLETSMAIGLFDPIAQGSLFRTMMEPATSVRRRAA